MLSAKVKGRLLWWLLFLSALIPLALMVTSVLQNNLGPDPVAKLLDVSGEWAIQFLWLVLAITPLRILFKWNGLAKYRRMVGLYALFYTSIHALVYLTFELQWDVALIADALVERPYISVGAPALLILMVLGITSYKPLIRRMGVLWVKVHRAVYAAAVLALVHIIWQVRSDYGEALVYASILVLLFGVRLYNVWRKQQRRRARLAVQAKPADQTVAKSQATA